MRDARFWDRIAEKYARSKISDEAAYQRKLAITQALFASHMNVLEFGCGTGSTAIKHAPFVRHYHATDISSGMLDIAQRKTSDAGLTNLSFEQTGLDEIAREGQQYDAILGMSILHLVDDMTTAVRQAHDLLVPGGVFVTSTVCMSESFWFLRPIMPIGRWLGAFPAVRFFSRNTLEQRMRDVGFSIEHSWKPGKRSAVFIVARKAA